ncbi:hypothetical protein [Collimonas humicola]|uniref:hypothetical protein n=1 Tax=Collimonas humicola TaxID=2825886 RepID=UPI001B8D765A|nr:hypothetical protein [Collimonas humicola]
MQRYSPLISLAISLIALPVFGANLLDSPLKTAKIFCSLQINGRLWANDDYQDFAKIATPNLINVVNDAIQKNKQWVGRHPGSKPPLGNGIGFISVLDSPFACIPKLITLSNKTAAVAVKYTHKPGAQYPETPLVTDYLRLLKSGKSWVIDDIEYGGGGSQGMTLKRSLKNIDW